MARKVTWLNEDGQTCILTIQDGSNTVVNLTPADEPFTTSIQESDDLFTPIRTSNGYIRIVVDSVDDIADVVGSSPLSRPITLEVAVVNRWVGFLACESFTQSWDRGPIELELPVVSPLEVTRGLYPSSALEELGYINFAQFLLNMNSALGAPFYEFYFPVLSNPIDTLQYQFDMRNYAKSTDKNTGYEVESYYDILEDICKLFGWQAIEYEENLVFLAADVKNLEQGTGNNYRGYNLTRMRSIANGSQPTPTDKPAFTPTIPTIFGADHNMSWIAGKKSVEVTGQLNERDESIWSVDVFEQCQFNGNYYHGENQSLIPVRYTVKKMACITGGNIEVFNNVFSGGAANPDTEGNNIKYTDAFTSSHNVYGGTITYEQFAEYGNTMPYKKIIGGDLDFHQRLIIKAYSVPLIKCATIHTNFWYDKTQNQAYNAFRITGNVKYATEALKAFESTWEGDKYLEISLYIKNGNTEYYYDRTNGWNTNGGTLQVYVSDGQIDEASYNNIPAPDGITGEVILVVWASTDGIGSGYVAIENLSILLYTKEGRTKGKQSPRIELDELRTNENTKKINLNNGFTDAWSQDCGLTLAREAVPDSYGVVLNASKSQPSSLYSSKWPEDALALRAQTYFSKARLRIKAIVKSVGQMLNPLIPYRFTNNGQPFICIEQQQNWRTNEVTGSFYEPSYNSL